MHIPSPTPKKHARVEIVPLIDIMFFLLATFVMVSLSMVKNKGVSVILPAAASATDQEHREHVVISLTDSGGVFLDKEEIDPLALSEQLRGLFAKNPELRVFINGDENARLGLAISVLDETRKLGITKVAFQTRPKP
jgi:biopolymer transport protein ExbD